MGRMGYGYGSEFHLLRWMGRHRKVFDRYVLDAIGRSGSTIDWIDFNFDLNIKGTDIELKGLEFLGTHRELQEQWSKFWPVGSGIHNWDAVGWVSSNEGHEVLLVEAKAHVDEIKASCGAKDQQSINRIKRAFEDVKKDLKVSEEKDWMKPYYQFTNRVSVLYFLRKHDIPARLLFIYFVGDRPSQTRQCPRSVGEWEKILAAQAEYVGLTKGHILEDRIHKLFLTVDGKVAYDR
jgi:hypothetical protein